MKGVLNDSHAINKYVGYQNYVRNRPSKIRRIKDDARIKDMDKFSIDQRCVDVDTMAEMYDQFLSELLDKHAPLKIKI